MLTRKAEPGDVAAAGKVLLELADAGETLTAVSIIDSQFIGTVVRETAVAGRKAVVPSISVRSAMTGAGSCADALAAPGSELAPEQPPSATASAIAPAASPGRTRVFMDDMALPFRTALARPSSEGTPSRAGRRGCRVGVTPARRTAARAGRSAAR